MPKPKTTRMITQLTKLKDNQTIVYKLQKLISEIVAREFDHAIDSTEVVITQTADAKFGDYTSNISLQLSKALSKNPREIGETIRQHISDASIAKTELAGPGFINIFLSNEYYVGSIAEILDQDASYGKWSLSDDQVMIEFGQPNTHKAFHVGHFKSAITGLSSARLIKNLGFEVLQANFFGDVGMHVAKCIWGYQQKGKPEGFEQLDPHAKMKYLDACYAFGANQFKDDKTAEDEIRVINKKVYDRSDDEINLIYLQTREWSIEHQNDAFKKLGIVYDRQYPESEISDKALEIVKTHIGDIFEEDQSAIIFPGDKYGLNRWVFISFEGNPTYSAKDLALANKKFEDFPELAFSIVTTSVEQNDYFKGVIKALSLIDSKFDGKYYHLGFGWLLRNNKKTSSRMGESIKGMDIINEATEFSLQKISEAKKYTPEEAAVIAEKVAIAGLKFLVLSHEFHTDINYDPEQFTNPEGFSGPYILYGYVRAKSILRQVEQQSETQYVLGLDSINDSELKLMKLLSKYPFVTLEAGRTLSPHKVANYLFELTQEFNSFYRENKVIVDDEAVKNFRVSLTKSVAIVLKNGLDLLGIETIEQM